MPFAPPKKQIERTVEGVAEAEKRAGEQVEEAHGREWTPALGHGEDTVKVMTLEQLLPLSFGESECRPQRTQQIFQRSDERCIALSSEEALSFCAAQLGIAAADPPCPVLRVPAFRPRKSSKTSCGLKEQPEATRSELHRCVNPFTFPASHTCILIGNPSASASRAATLMRHPPCIREFATERCG